MSIACTFCTVLFWMSNNVNLGIFLELFFNFWLITPLEFISKILLVYSCKCCNLIGWAIAHYQLLVCSGWNSCTIWRRFSVLPKVWREILMKMVNLNPEKTKRRTFSFSWLKKSWNYWKNDAHACTTSILNANTIRAIFLGWKV